MMTEMIALTVNGELREIAAGSALAALAATLGLDPGRVAVERNGEIVPRAAYGATRLQAGDRLEIVHFVGGG